MCNDAFEKGMKVEDNTQEGAGLQVRLKEGKSPACWRGGILGNCQALFHSAFSVGLWVVRSWLSYHSS